MKWGRISLVIFGALIVTALGIDAADTMSGSRGTLLSQVIGRDDGECPSTMTLVQNVATLTCVDIYEVSPGKTCPMTEPENMLGSNKNIETATCVPESVQGVKPWRFITRDQAMQACARVGKRLPTSSEWYQMSLGMADVDAVCNTNSGSVAQTGASAQCVSPIGAYDLVGNVWEWVSDDVIDGKYQNQTLPAEGYVSQVDATGVATMTTNDAQTLFGKDYFWSAGAGAYGIIRGGYYDSGEDAGVYAVHADTLPTSASAGIGFRCVK